MASIPRIDAAAAADSTRRLEEIPGVVPSLRHEIVGCTFAPRCRLATKHCRRVTPVLEEKTPGHSVACWETDRVRSFHHD
jgi:peptide/nickel transport system ATP-binding protein